MSGTERLRTLAGAWDEWGLGGTLAEMADQIERERACDEDTIESVRLIVGGVVDEMELHTIGHEGVEDSPVARWARELREALGCDEHDHADEREAIAWVREHGGIESVKEEWNRRSNLKRSLETAQAKVGREKRHIMFVQRKCRERQEHIVELNKMVADMCPRLMPEGMELLVEAWPRFKDDAPVRLLDDFERYGEENGVSAVTMYADGSFALNFRAYSKGERVNRPALKVLDADGVEIRVGDEVWDVDGSGPFIVSGFVGEPLAVIFEISECNDLPRKPSQLTHQRPVLAADGKPLREGETVWSVDSGTRYTVEKITDELIPIKCRSEMGSTVSLCPSQLTHQRPVLDADGMPIKKGDTVWEVGTVLAIPMTVVEVSSDTVRCEYTWTDGKVYRPCCSPDTLTNTKPEIDSWERIEEDALNFVEDNAGIPHDQDQMERDMLAILRRCRALAERERGE